MRAGAHREGSNLDGGDRIPPLAFSKNDVPLLISTYPTGELLSSSP